MIEIALEGCMYILRLEDVNLDESSWTVVYCKQSDDVICLLAKHPCMHVRNAGFCKTKKLKHLSTKCNQSEFWKIKVMNVFSVL